MAVEFINFIQNGIVFTEEEKLLKPLIARLAASKKIFLLVRETWINREEFSDLIKDKKFDAVVTLSLMDTPFIDYSFLNNFPVYKIGYFKNSPYYFDFHSFMTLKYLKIDNDILPKGNEISIPFMCLNGKPHVHREKLVLDLLAEKLNKKNIISYNSVGSGFTLSADKFNQSTILPSPYDVYSLGDKQNWKKHFLNVVTETNFDNENNFFITEKTYKPILGFKPFIVHSVNGNINILKKFNFETYYNDFNDISDLDLTDPTTHVEFLKILSKQETKYFHKKYKNLLEKILYNRDNFFKHAKNQIDNLKNFSDHIF